MLDRLVARSRRRVTHEFARIKDALVVCGSLDTSHEQKHENDDHDNAQNT